MSEISGYGAKWLNFKTNFFETLIRKALCNIYIKIKIFFQNIKYRLYITICGDFVFFHTLYSIILG